jgi:DNA-binding transcriptional MerR regulator
MRDGFTIGELALACGVSRDTVRFYERERLLPPARRTAAGYRLYGENEAGRVRLIRRAKSMGLTLEDIRELLRVQRVNTPEQCRRPRSDLRMVHSGALF